MGTHNTAHNVFISFTTLDSEQLVSRELQQLDGINVLNKFFACFGSRMEFTFSQGE